MELFLRDRAASKVLWDVVGCKAPKHTLTLIKDLIDEFYLVSKHRIDFEGGLRTRKGERFERDIRKWEKKQTKAGVTVL